MFNRVSRLLILTVLAGPGCASSQGDGAAPIVQPGAPGAASRTIGAAEAADLSAVSATPADVRFMQDMIGHHAQALEMTGLLRSRTTSPAMRKLAERIDASQADEITMMRQWLSRRGAPLPDPHAHHAAPMPGMLSPAEMDRLGRASGAEFDRLFLESII